MSSIKAWRTIERKPAFRCRIFAVEQTRAVSPFDRDAHDFFRVRSADWAQLVPVTSAGEVVMVRQYRHGSETVTLECPGGLVDEGEDPAAAAARECLEETGYRATDVEPLGIVNPNPALFSNRLHAYCAHGVERIGTPSNHSTEQTEVVLVPLAEMPSLLRSGVIDHALIAGTLWRFLADRADLR